MLRTVIFLMLFASLYAERNDYLEILETSLDKLSEAYVDSVNEDELIKSGIKGMLQLLDPYTKLLVGSGKDNIDMLRTGKYGGVGIQIGTIFDTLTVLNTFEDSPAYLEGLHIGDQIMQIDSIETKGMKIPDIAKLIKGQLGTEVTLHIIRAHIKEMLEFSLTRADIKVKHVPYYGLDENNIGYIRISKFSKNTATDFRNALIRLTKTPIEEFEDINQNGYWDNNEPFNDNNNNNRIDYRKLDGLVIDLRSNSGGLLRNALSMLDKIIDRGSVLLTTKGKLKKQNKAHTSRAKPIIDPSIPMAVLINKSSASASEIFAGVIQDYDRGIIIGQKSFGKGLVQSMYNLNDTTTLKITTAKYYLPSGRLIQKQDYMKDGFFTDGLDKKDSTFTTLKNNRIVSGGGGITPDIITTSINKSDYIKALWRKKLFLKFSSIYTHNNTVEIPVVITDKIMSDFKVFLEGYDLEYLLPGERELNKLEDKLSLYSENNKSKDLLDQVLFWRESEDKRLIDRLHEYYENEKINQFDNPLNHSWIRNGLQREMSIILGGKEEQIRVSLFEDSDYLQAVEVLKDANNYYNILSKK